MNSPQAFDEEKYQALLGGLECSEVLLSELERTARIDAEFYSKENLNIASKLQQYKTKPITEQFYISDGNHMSVSNDFRTEGIPYYRGQDTNNIFIENASPICISEEYYQQKNMLRSHLKKNDILLSIVGTIGNTCMVYSSEKATCSCKLAILRPKNATIKPFLVNVFLMSKYGQNQIKKFVRGAVQTGFLLEDMEQLLIPSLGEVFGNTVQKLMEKIHLLIEQSKSAYTSAETLLLKSLNLQNFTPSRQNTSVKSFSETFASGRLDAEYYQKKYDEIEERIKKFKHIKLNDLCVLINHGMQPPYVENGEMRVFSQKWIGDKGIDYGFIDDINEPRTSLKFAKENPNYVCRENDILHYSVGANIGYCHAYLSDIPMMPGSFITLIRADETKINPIYLAIVLNSVIGRLQSEKRKSGTAQPYIYPKDLKQFVVPILPEPIQQQISAKVKESFALREKSKQLLKAATKAVEIAIEEGEAAAFKYLEK